MNTLLVSTLAGVAASIGGLAAVGSPSALEPAPAVYDYRPEFLPQDASVVVHFDLASFRRSTFGELFMQSRDQFELEDLDEMERELGFDPLEALNSVTLYGAGENSEPSTAVILASSAIDTALHRAEEDGAIRHMNVDGIELFQYEDTFGYIEVDGNDRILVLAEDQSSVVRGARVVRGNGESLRDAGVAAADMRPRAGSFFFLTAKHGFAGAQDFEPTSQIMGLAESFRLDAGEANGSLFAHLGIATGDPQTAADVMDIVRAFLAFGRLMGAAEGPPELAELLQALRVNTRGGTVLVDFEYSVDTLAHLILSTLAEQY